MSLPYYKRFPRDFLEGTIGLSFEVKGAYAIVLDLIYMRSGRLPDDPRYISGQLGCSVRKWSAIREELIAQGKIQVVAGIISNFRADYLTEESRKYQDKQSEIAGKPRKNKPVEQPKPSQSESEPDIEDKSSNTKRARPFPDDWKPTDGDLSYAAAQGLSPEEINRAVEDFRDYFIAAGPSRKSTNWSLNWKRWCRTSADKSKQRRYGPRMAGEQKPAGRGQGSGGFASIAARRKLEREQGMAVPRGGASVSGGDDDWSNGAIDGESWPSFGED